MPEAHRKSRESDGADLLADVELRRALTEFVKRRVPSHDVDDVVQTVLVEALASKARPTVKDELRRWLLGVARHKVVDLHRKHHREPIVDDEGGVADQRASAPPVEEQALVGWAEKQVGESAEAARTLRWMAREGEGEKLEHIAAEEAVAPATMRQRVSRLRRQMRERWLAELAAVAALGVLLFVAWRWWKRDELAIAPERLPAPTAPAPEAPLRRANQLREEARRACDEARWAECLRSLDDARALDPEGDAAEAMRALRKQADDALRPPPLAPPSQAPTGLPAPTSKPPTSEPAPKSDPDEAPKTNEPPPTPKAPPPTKPQAPPTKKYSPKEAPAPFEGSKAAPKSEANVGKPSTPSTPSTATAPWAQQKSSGGKLPSL